MWIGSAVRGVLVLYCVFINASASSECDLCRDIVKEFKSGLAKTEKSGFAGGNTNWEEKSLGKWKTSETRLVEIVDNHVCKHDSKACHAFIEKHEEALEDWYFNIYKDQDNSDGLDEHLCIDFAKVCCPPGTFSRNCDQMCPMDEGGVCGGRGKCDGDGTRSGLGVCKCDDGYQGKFCDICSDKYYQEATGNIKLCKKCDVSCEDTCTGEGPNGCDDCADGYTWDSNKGCLDDNECETEGTCIEGKYCVNTDGSHECKACSGDCKACIGGKAADCTLCADGYQRQNTEEETSICEDMDECQSESQLCKNIEGAACVNTVGSFDCKCSAENHVIEGDKCVEKPADPLQESQDEEDANKKSDDDKKSKIDSSNKSSKGKKKSSSSTKSKTKSAKAPHPDLGPGTEQKIDLDKMMEDSHKLPPGQKRKYRALDSMTLVSGTGLYLVLVLVFQAEFFKTSLVTIFYSVFLYMYSGTYV